MSRSERKSLCPVCAKTAHSDYAPFCSKRCADVDLHRWLSGGYAIPGEHENAEDDLDPGQSESLKSG